MERQNLGLTWDICLTSKTWLRAGAIKLGSGQLKLRLDDSTGIPVTSSDKIATMLLHVFLREKDGHW